MVFVNLKHAGYAKNASRGHIDRILQPPSGLVKTCTEPPC